MQMTAPEILSLARTRILGTSLDDLGASLGKANLVYGLAKILWYQQEAGYPTDAAFHMTADFAVTRNRTRWSLGFAYGGMVTWTGPFMILDLKPNACGMMAGGLQALPDLDRWRRLTASGIPLKAEVDGEQAEWDFETSNHFFQLYRAEWKQGGGSNPPYVFIIHGSGDEHRHLLYFDRDDFAFADRIHLARTPWGPLHLLLDDDAETYWSSYLQAQTFACKRREAFARLVVGDYTPLTHVIHQGLVGRNSMALGSQAAVEGHLYPFAQSEALPAYLLTPPKGTTTSLLPHGSGYLITEPFQRVVVEGAHDDDRRAVLVDENHQYKVVDDIRALTYVYRGTETLELVMNSHQAEIASILTPMYRITAEGVRAI